MRPRTARHVRVAAYALVLGMTAVTGLTGCRSGAVTPPASTTAEPSSNPRAGSAESAGGGKYSWDLPAGDTSPSGNEGSFYGYLMQCDGAVEELRSDRWWENFNSPRNLLLYMAAAHLCRGDTEAGRPYYEEAMSQYGSSGLGTDSRPCDVYRSVSSVLLQRARDSFACPGGQLPIWRETDGNRDNPLTFDVDESAPSASPSPESTAAPTGQPTESTADSTDEPSGAPSTSSTGPG